MTQLRKPSAFAEHILAGMRVAANAEIQKHLRAGRAVHGIREDGEPITIGGTDEGAEKAAGAVDEGR